MSLLSSEYSSNFLPDKLYFPAGNPDSLEQFAWSKGVRVVIYQRDCMHQTWQPPSTGLFDNASSPARLSITYFYLKIEQVRELP